MKFALIVIGIVALAVMFAGCTSQEQKVDNGVNVGNGIIVSNETNVSATITPLYANQPVVSLGNNESYQLTGAEVQGCAIAAYIDSNGTVDMRNAPNNPVGCPTNAIGKV